MTLSRPARGAWVEILLDQYLDKAMQSRAPQGARGLKYVLIGLGAVRPLSRPARGAWVEMLMAAIRLVLSSVAPRKGRVG